MAVATRWSETPLCWEQLQQFLAEGAIEKLVRSHAQNLSYCAAFDRMSAEWVSVGDRILCTVFGWAAEAESGAPGAKRRAVPPPGAPGRELRWRLNDFPYSFAEAEVEHHLLWCAGGELDAAELEAEAERRFPSDAWEKLTFVNVRHLQSVTNVWHAHAFVRPRRPAAA